MLACSAYMQYISSIHMSSKIYKGINSMVECLFYTQNVKGSNPLFLKSSLT